MKSPKVAIIISTYNKEKLLIECLKSLKKTKYKNYKIYLIDDSGKGKIGKDIKKKFPKIRIIINKTNLGFSKSNNKGIKKALKEYNPDYFLLLNDDTEIIENNWLEEIIKEGEKDRKIGILGLKIIYPDGKLQHLGGYVKKWRIMKELNEKKKKAFEVDHVMGAFMMIKKETINKVGLLDEKYSPFLLEDTDYCLNAKKKGFKIVSIPKVKIIHKKGKSIDSLENKKIMKTRIKNDIYFSRKNLLGTDKFIRIFVYLPIAIIFKKKKDESPLNPLNFRLRKGFLRNLFFFISELKVLFKKDD